jgi:hypothetical protein
MTAFRWFMRNGAPILFAISLIVFVVSFAGPSLRPTGFGPVPSEPGQASARLWLLISTFANALSHCALTFFGACLLYRIDRHWPGGEAAK